MNSPGHPCQHPAMKPPRGFSRVWAIPAVLILALGFAACGRNAPESRSPPKTTLPVEDLKRFTSLPIGSAVGERPWITHVALTDLDRDGRLDVIACDGKEHRVLWLRQSAPGRFEESVLAAGIPAPVHTEAVDFDGDGDLDLLVASMGQIFPINDKIGSVVLLENRGDQTFEKHVILEQVARVTDVRAGDLNGDGRPDLAVALFGYDEGEIRWLENLGGLRFRSHPLLSLSGTVNVCVADMDGNGTPDIVALVSQQWEEIHLFRNDGRGNFTPRILFGSTNEDFGSSGISLADINRDGRPDILYTNGDGFDYAQPGSRPWHGVQWLENLGDGDFRYHRIGNLPGAYSPVAADIDRDGHPDIVVVSAFNRWDDPKSASLVWFRNDGRNRFSPQVLAHAPTHLVTLAAGDIEGDGRTSLVTGGFHAYPPWDRMSRILLWRQP